MTLHQVSIPDFIGMQISKSGKYESLTRRVKYDSLPPKYLIEPGYGRVNLSYRKLTPSVSDAYKSGVSRGY